jgi:thiol-disulfide isomerase/thioredoxin
MSDEILLRLVWVVLLAGGGAALYAAANRLVLLRLRRVTAQPGPAGGLVQTGRPALLYFTTPTCAPCKTFQRPTIQRLQAQVGERLQVVEIDASTDTELADRWGVLSVPTTFLLDSAGQPRFVNHGVTPLDKLARQVEQLG